MLFSLWLSVVLAGGQTGCSMLKKEPQVVAPAPIQSRPMLPPNAGGGLKRGLQNPDFYQIPKVPPPGARYSYSSVRVNGPYIAMTFDDGPHPTNTPRLLNMLKERNIKATFYVVGQLAREYPNIIRRILAEGHEIGNHTYTHPILTKVSDDRIRKELGDTHKALVDIAGYHPRTMRPPGGGTNARLKQWFHDEYGYSTIMWSVDPMDWKRPGVSVVTSRLVNGAHPGAILLAHDLHAPTIDAMPNTLDGLLSKGYRFVTVSQLINMEVAAPVGGPAVAGNAASAPGAPAPLPGLGAPLTAPASAGAPGVGFPQQVPSEAPLSPAPGGF
ncbi:polysaccharide deacetylase family protein [Verrucomicrobium spinosum]|uniref:polysaccharide deacetylase family protein n=1 Tax=Verrucomicrobium spinosum TaxID=2736 RepID=UPI0001746322|nr:polysaccharide deacetylase family protein [Verrucomicrobium spinosum]